MPLTIGWREIGVRLFFTVLAGALIGWNRGEHGHPAGLRTTLLVCLAAAVSMIETNLLLDTRGKTGDSFSVLDLARFPLGILSGMGFIGAGAILRHGDRVQGITTAATLWFITMVGLCIGGGQIGIGIAATLIGFAVLSAVKRLEDYLPIERRAVVELTVEPDSAVPEELTERLAQDGYQVVKRSATRQNQAARRRIHYELQWRAPAARPAPSDWLDTMAAAPGVIELSWKIGAPLPASAGDGPVP